MKMMIVVATGKMLIWKKIVVPTIDNHNHRIGDPIPWTMNDPVDNNRENGDTATEEVGATLPARLREEGHGLVLWPFLRELL